MKKLIKLLTTLSPMALTIPVFTSSCAITSLSVEISFESNQIFGNSLSLKEVIDGEPTTMTLKAINHGGFTSNTHWDFSSLPSYVKYDTTNGPIVHITLDQDINDGINSYNCSVSNKGLTQQFTITTQPPGQNNFCYFDNDHKFYDVNNNTFGTSTCYKGVDILTDNATQPDWNTVINENNLDFLYLKIGQGDQKQIHFNDYVNSITSFNTKFGVFYYPNNIENDNTPADQYATNNANEVIEWIKSLSNESLALMKVPVALDVDFPGEFNKDSLNTYISTFKDVINSAGYQCLLYCPDSPDDTRNYPILNNENQKINNWYPDWEGILTHDYYTSVMPTCVWQFDYAFSSENKYPIVGLQDRQYGIDAMFGITL